MKIGLRAIARVFVLFAAHNSFAATTQLRGVIHDAQHRPLPGAEVVIEGVSVPQPVTVLSDQNGEFESQAVPPGSYTVSVSARGFQTLQQKVEVQSGQNPVLHLQLEVASLSETVKVSSEASALKT